MKDNFKCEDIKTLLQRLSGVEDIGFRSRKRFIVDLKFTYYKLCREFTKSSLQLIGEVLGEYDHATVIHGIEQFENLYNTKNFSCNVIYKECQIILANKLTDRLTLVKLDKVLPSEMYDLNRKHLIALIEMSEKSHSIIKRKAVRIKELEKEIQRLKSHLLY